jgi:hypothetical protein
MSAETGHLGVNVSDIRHANILAAAEGPTSLPALPSPFTGRTYPYRIIDLELSEKINSTPDVVAGLQEGLIERIVINSPYGNIIEPWE